MNDREQKAAAKQFAETWKDRGNEKSDTSSFWISLLRDVYGIKNPEDYIEFEKRVKVDGSTRFIDGYIPNTLVLIEQKDITKDLNKASKQSGGDVLTPYQQAKRYADNLRRSEKPEWIITCNFKEFYIHDMEHLDAEPIHLLLEDLPKNYNVLNILISEDNKRIKLETEISLEAGNLVGELYNTFYKAYKKANLDDETIHINLNRLCVRIVFCLYAEDSGIFGRKDMFHDYMELFDSRFMRVALADLFKVLNQKEEERDPFLDESLSQFPYVNGGLFEKDIIIPQVTDEIRELLLTHASEDFDWSDISPTIFGAVFESTLNPDTRRSGGMHYTSIENIHKVIDPLFLNDLKEELRDIKGLKAQKTIEKRVLEFQNKLASLKFLDPACGSGNFLTETYLSLRKLENEAIDFMRKGQTDLFATDKHNSQIKVNISQFYGIEYNDFAVTVGKTALWIAESQMMQETSEVLGVELNFLPLKTNANIVEGNALRMDWNDIVSKNELNYIMGNPPFIGYKLQTERQKQDLRPLLGNTRNIDYVCGWYIKSAEYIQNTNIEVAFVSTNSITQGEQVPSLWKIMYSKYNICINFAYRSFIWNSEASSKAHVHCVIVGFSSMIKSRQKYIFEDDIRNDVKQINPYLVDASTVFIEKRALPICHSEKMIYGSEPREGGNLILNESEANEILNQTPEMAPYIKRFVSSDDFINNKIRYCLWFTGGNLSIARKSKLVVERLEKCRAFRAECKQKQANAAQDTPYLFASPRQPESDYLLIPIVSSENRKYIPIGYMGQDVIVSNACFSLPNASLYSFGVITSNVHMAWMRLVAGRLESRYRYSNTIVYNNFPWPSDITDVQKMRIEESAQDILDARSLYPEMCLADLYDQLTMPIELVKAHKKNDKAVMEAYGFNSAMSEAEIVTKLMKMYQKSANE